MKFKSQIFAILAVFCVILSVCAVSAAVSSESGNITGGDNYDPGVPYHDDGTDPTETSAGDVNQTDNSTDGDMYDPGVPYHADGTDPTETPIGNETNSTGNATQQAAGEPATSAHSMLATGNPILVLMVIGAVLGGVGLINRRK